MKKNIVHFLALLIFTTVFAAVSNGQSSGNSDSSVKQPDAAQQTSKDQRVKIKNKPFVRTANCPEPSGVTTVRAVFDKSAAITKVEIVKSSGCTDFDRNAVEAARKIKFSPAIKDGEAVTTTKLLQYSFSRY